MLTLLVTVEFYKSLSVKNIVEYVFLKYFKCLNDKITLTWPRRVELFVIVLSAKMPVMCAEHKFTGVYF